jgi:HPt (histidine-containing phosphotransfer) domain-containing protein
MTNEKIIIHIAVAEILQLIPIYLAKRREELGVLQDAVVKNDFEILQDLGHKMKGSGGSFGLDRISEIGGNMESSAKAQDLPAIEQEIAELMDYLDRVEVVGK